MNARQRRAVRRVACARRRPARVLLGSATVSVGGVVIGKLTSISLGCGAVPTPAPMPASGRISMSCSFDYALYEMMDGLERQAFVDPPAPTHFSGLLWQTESERLRTPPKVVTES
jgi:hypothetical protein